METITKTYNYKGLTIQQVTQTSGRKTYDVRNFDGSIFELGLSTLAVAKATVNAALSYRGLTRAYRVCL